MTRDDAMQRPGPDATGLRLVLMRMAWRRVCDREAKQRRDKKTYSSSSSLSSLGSAWSSSSSSASCFLLRVDMVTRMEVRIQKTERKRPRQWQRGIETRRFRDPGCGGYNRRD
jgi:hypothetical protein